MSDSISCPDILLVPDLENCISTYNSGLLPVVLYASDIPDWIREISDCTEEDLCRPSVSDFTSTVCSIGSDPLVISAAQELARRTKRLYCNVDPARDAIEHFFRTSVWRSCCFIGPPFSVSVNTYDVMWLSHLISSARKVWGEVELTGALIGPCWGVIAAPDLESFTAIVARSALAPRIARVYRSSPSCISPRNGPHWEAPNHNSDTVSWAKHITQQRIAVLPSKEFSAKNLTARVGEAVDWLLLEGHGRSYCLSEGVVCGGRRLEEAPESNGLSCLSRLNCVDRHLRIDPRVYNARIVLLDCCEAANPSGLGWTLGFESVAYRFVAGRASAVIATDIMIVRGDQEIVDLYLHAAYCETIGEVLLRLNLLRRQDNPVMPYILVGDPQTPAWGQKPDGFMNLTRQSNSVNLLFPLELTPGSKLQAVQLASSDSHVSAANICYFIDRSGQQFLATRFTSVETLIGCRAIALAPAGIPDLCAVAVYQATEVDLLGAAPSSAAPPKFCVESEIWIQFIKAINEILLLTQEIGETTVNQKLAEVSSNLVLKLVSATKPKLWLDDLWVANTISVSSGAICNLCGDDNSFARTYRSGASLRVRMECRHCKITSDFPMDVPMATCSMETPLELLDDSIEVIITITANVVPLIGAVSCLLTGKSHDINIKPDSLYFIVKERDTAILQFKSLGNVEQNKVHIHYVRAIIVINGQMFWLSRQIVLDNAIN